MAHATAAILSMGDELTLGQRLNTNSHWLAARLLDLGITTIEHVTVPDDLDASVRALQRLAASADLTVSTGGLGPTADDLCREALARATGDSLVEDPTALAQLAAWFASRKREMPPINRVQAQRPSRGTCLANARGTAPGLAARLGSCDIFCLPGPPSEMTAMFESGVRPRLLPPTGRIIKTRALHCYGIGESELASRLGPLMDRRRHPLVGTTASGGVVSIRIRFDAPGTESDAELAIEATTRAALGAAGPHCFGRDAATLQDSLLSELRTRARTLAVVESCTGGMLASMLTEVPGASAVFLGGWITYSNEMKTTEVDVPPRTLIDHGAVSRETAVAMARGGLHRGGADYCLSITGIAGPDGGSEAKPVGTVWVALASREDDAVDARCFAMGGGDRQSVREWSARSAMMMLLLHLRGAPPTTLLRQAPESSTS